MKASFFLTFLFTTFLFFSCGDSCDLVDCGPNGKCKDGSCLCDLGYRGEFCETQFCSSDFFLGTFEGNLKCKSSKEKHSVASFTKESENDITLYYGSGGTYALELDLSNCMANYHESNFLWTRTITVTLIDELIEFRLQYYGLGSDCYCTGFLTK